MYKVLGRQDCHFPMTSELFPSSWTGKLNQQCYSSLSQRVKKGWSGRETSRKPNILNLQQERLRLDLRRDFLKAKETSRDLRKLPNSSLINAWVWSYMWTEELTTKLSGLWVLIERWLPFSEESEKQGLSLTCQPGWSELIFASFSILGFLNLDAVDSLGWIIPCLGARLASIF